MDELQCRHFLRCYTIWYNADRPDNRFSLGRVVVSITPSVEDDFPFTCPRLFAYGQLYGEEGEHTLWIRLVRIDLEGYDGESEIEIQIFPRFRILVTGEALVDEFGFTIKAIEFPEPGVYEFQLWADERTEPLACERIEARS